MGAFESNSRSLTSSDDCLTGNFNKKILDSHNRTAKAWRSKRGSKTMEELTELQLPMTKRDSMMENFKTDDDLRREKLRKVTEQSADDVTDDSDDDDDDEKSQ